MYTDLSRVSVHADSGRAGISYVSDRYHHHIDEDDIRSLREATHALLKEAKHAHFRITSDVAQHAFHDPHTPDVWTGQLGILRRQTLDHARTLQDLVLSMYLGMN
jgi:hypothetical protein